MDELKKVLMDQMGDEFRLASMTKDKEEARSHNENACRIAERIAAIDKEQKSAELEVEKLKLEKLKYKDSKNVDKKFWITTAVTAAMGCLGFIGNVLVDKMFMDQLLVYEKDGLVTSIPGKAFCRKTLFKRS